MEEFEVLPSQPTYKKMPLFQQAPQKEFAKVSYKSREAERHKLTLCHSEIHSHEIIIPSTSVYISQLVSSFQISTIVSYNACYMTHSSPSFKRHSQ